MRYSAIVGVRTTVVESMRTATIVGYSVRLGAASGRPVRPPATGSRPVRATAACDVRICGSRRMRSAARGRLGSRLL